MKVLVLGNGGREHAMGLALRRSPGCGELFFAPGNPGMAQLGCCLSVQLDNPSDIVRLAREIMPDLVVIGPEIPLCAGAVDALEDAGFLAFGPRAKAAALEGSKAFSKAIMEKYSIPTATHKTFTSLAEAQKFVRAKGAPIVIKASGLAAGKGAIVCLTLEQAETALEDMLGPRAIFGQSGSTVVVEEYMQGEEASIFALCDGKDFLLLASAQDHKRAFDGDLGPNTGGMGAYAPAPLVTAELLETIKRTIIEPTLAGMRAEGIPYTGVLFVGIMVTEQGPKVVEYNCRLGDPETQVVLPLCQDFLGVVLHTARGTLAQYKAPEPLKGSAAVVVVAASGYPGSYAKDLPIAGIEKAQKTGASVLQAGTRQENGQLLSAGGRVLGVVGQGDTLRQALEIAYKGVDALDFPGSFHRRDIGQKGLLRNN